MLTFKIIPIPTVFNIRNLNPSTSLIVPWSFVGNLEDFVGSKSNYVETGFNPGAGVLAISSAGVMFVEASGRRALLPLHLDGFPTCWTRLPQNCLVMLLLLKPRLTSSSWECILLSGLIVV